MKRHFELLDGKSAKFWEIELDGKSHTVRYGKLGAKGQSKTKTFADADAAKKDAEKLIKSKTKKGYAEVEDDAGGAGAATVDAATLEAQLVKLDADPSPEGRLVFGDWLQSVGHPWGALISHDHAGQTAERDGVLAANPTLLGDLSRRAKQTSVVWRQGFIDEATIISGGNPTVLKQCLQALFALPVARYLRRLVLDGDRETFTTYRDWDDSRENMVRPFGAAVIRELAKAPKTLVELSLGASPPTSASAYVSVPNLAAVAKALPKLDALEVQCTGEESIEGFGFSKLRRLDMRFANANDSDLEAVRDAKLPVLEELSVWLGGSVHCILDDVHYPEELEYDEETDEYDYDQDRYPSSYAASDLDLMNVYSVDASLSASALENFCGAPWPESLKHLGIQSAILDEASLKAIFTSGLVKQLEILDLSGGTMADKGAKVVARHAKQLGHLERLDLGRNYIGKKGIAAIEKALPNADCSGQRTGDKAPEFLFRYVATME